MSKFAEDLAVIRNALPSAKKAVGSMGGTHPYWQFILDAEALTEGRPTIQKGRPEILAHGFRKWIEKAFPTP